MTDLVRLKLSLYLSIYGEVGTVDIPNYYTPKNESGILRLSPLTGIGGSWGFE
jgi:hypothetical protein